MTKRPRFRCVVATAIVTMILAPAKSSGQLRLGDAEKWLTAEDIAQYLPTRKFNRIVFNLNVNEEGIVVSCLSPIGSFNDTAKWACPIIQRRASYVKISKDRNKKSTPIKDMLAYDIIDGSPVLLSDFGGAEWTSGGMSSLDYPRHLLAKRAEGSSWIKFNISSAGRASNCQVAKGSGFAELDIAACSAVVRRFRFRAPIASNGERTETEGRFMVHWRISSFNQ